MRIRHRPQHLRLDVAAIVLLAFVVRVPAVLTDFWFDEIFSYERFARTARSVQDIFLSPALKHDNNHHLNTLTMYWLGDQTSWFVYRLPVTACGLLAVAGAVMVGRRRSRAEGVLSGLVAATSLMLVAFTTDARGYGWLIAFAVLGFLALDRFLRSGNRGALITFWIALAGGLASHATMLHFYLGALLWSGFHLRTRRVDLVKLHIVPAAWILFWAVAVLRGSTVGGGPPWTWSQIGDEGLAWTFGYPLGVIPAWAAGAVAAGLVLWDARRLWAEGSDEGLFTVGAILSPVIFVAALSPPYLFPRYFLVPILFLLLVVGRCLGRCWTTGPAGRAAVIALTLAFLAGNSVQIFRFVQERRGTHVAAVRLFLDSGPSSPIVVTSRSLDTWTEMPIRFYERRLGEAGRITYVPRATVAERSAAEPRIQWVVEPAQPCAPDPGTRLTLPNGDAFALTNAYRVCGPSGMSWFLFAREP
jgi:hypothetical protein